MARVQVLREKEAALLLGRPQSAAAAAAAPLGGPDPRPAEQPQ